MMLRWKMLQICFAFMLLYCKSFGKTVKKSKRFSNDQYLNTNSFIRDYCSSQTRKLNTEKECYSDKSLNEQILRKNRTDYNGFRYLLRYIGSEYYSQEIMLYDNQDIMMSFQLSRNEFDSYLGTLSNGYIIPVFMRLNGYNGIVKWTTIISIKEIRYDYLYQVYLIDVNSEDKAFIELISYNNFQILRIDGNGNAFQMIGFQSKNLNSLFMYASAHPISLTSFVFKFQPSKSQYGLGVSDNSGLDLAYMIGNFDLTTNYTLMMDYNNDIPYFNYEDCSDQYCYYMYITSTNSPQILMKFKLDMFAGLNFNGTIGNDCCYIGSLCTPFCGASYSDGFIPIIKALIIVPNLMTEVFFNKKPFDLLFNLVDKYLVVNYILNNNGFNVICFDQNSLEYSQSFIVTIPYQFLSNPKYDGLMNWSYQSVSYEGVNYLIFVNIVSKSIKVYKIPYKYYFIYNSMIVSYTNDGSEAYFQISEFSVGINTTDSCSLSFELANELNVAFTNTTETLVLGTNYTTNGFTAKAVNNGIYFFNIDYSPFPYINATFNSKPNAIFWPQPIINSKGNLCQSSVPIASSNNLIYHIGNKTINSSYTEEIRFSPFYNCQDVPTTISIVDSNLDTDFMNTYVSIQDEEVVINLIDIQISNDGIKLKCNGITQTSPEFSNTGFFVITLINQSPSILYSGSLSAIITDSDNTSNNTPKINFIVTDYEEDDIFYFAQLYSDSNATLPKTEVYQSEHQFSVYFNAELITIGEVILKFSAWDKYHIDSSNYVNISFYIRTNESKKIHFQNDIPSVISFVECEQTNFNLPLIINPNNSTFNIEIVDNSFDFIRITPTTLSVTFLNGNYGNYSIVIKLLEINGNSNYYPTIVNLSQPQFVNFDEFPKLITKYMNRNSTLTGVSEFSKCGGYILNSLKFEDYIDHDALQNYDIRINEFIPQWICYDESSKRIDILQFLRNNVGNYLLNITFNNNCSNQSFAKQLIIILLDKKPPVVVGNVPNITAYQGQESVDIIIPDDLFYDEDDNVSVTISSCNINDTVVTNSQFYNSIQGKISIEFKDSFIGLCEIPIIGLDSLLQNARTSFFINVIPCPQRYCELCNGSKNNECIQCINGYILDKIAHNCVNDRNEFEAILLLGFLLLCIPILVCTNYRFNVILIFIDSMQLMYTIFAFLPSIGSSFQNYFSNYIYLSFSGRDFIKAFKQPFLQDYSTINKNSYNQIIYSYPETVIFLIIYILMVCFQSRYHSFIKRRLRQGSIFLIWLSFVFQFFCFSIICNICMYNKPKSMLDIISLVFAIFLFICSILSFYCCILHNSNDCMLCAKITILRNARENFIIFDNMKSEYYLKIYIITHIRKLIICIFLITGVNGYLIFLYIACMICTQIYYHMVIFFNEIFHSLKDKLVINFIEIVTLAIILICCTMFDVTDSSNKAASFDNNIRIQLIENLKFLMKIFIVIVILIELISILIYFCTNISNYFKNKRKNINLQMVECMETNKAEEISPSQNKIALSNLDIEHQKVWNHKTKAQK